jgi:hypothetical protein
MCSALADHPYPAHRLGFILNSKVKPCTTMSTADQVQGLARAGIASAVTVNGMLSLPERHDAVEKVRMAMPRSC